MASNIDLNINIGANVTDLQAQLQKAENLLVQFQNALKKATNVGEINYLNNQIKNLNTTISSLGQQMNKVGRPATDATHALGNLSRVAQDAPYGFIGIANNLNPLLESFQQLSVKSGGAGGALKSMAAGLTGPAGIGIALAAVSSLVVAFGDDIQNFITEQVSGLGKSFKLESDIINQASSAYIKASTDINTLKDSYSDYQNGFITKEKFLKQFNSTLGDTIKQTNDLATAEKFLTDYADEYVQMTFKKAVANEAAAQSAKKQLEAEIAKNKPAESFTKAQDFGTMLFGGTTETVKVLAGKRRNDIVDEAGKDVQLLESIRKKYEDEANKIQEQFVKAFGVVDETKTTKPKKDKTLSYKDASFLIDQTNRTNDLLTPKEIAPEDTAIKDAEKQHENYLKWLTDWTKRKEKLAIENNNIEKKNLEELIAGYEKFASTISNTVTNALFGMFDAMQQGASATEALGQMFGNLLRQMAEMVIKAAIFSAIMSALNPASAGKGGLSFLGNFSKILGIPGLASGGVATGPTLAMIGEGNESEAVLPLSKLGGMLNTSFNAGAMSGGGAGSGQFILKGNDLVLALQRSTSSLNLRRG